MPLAEQIILVQNLVYFLNGSPSFHFENPRASCQANYFGPKSCVLPKWFSLLLFRKSVDTLHPIYLHFHVFIRYIEVKLVLKLYLSSEGSLLHSVPLNSAHCSCSAAG